MDKKTMPDKYRDLVDIIGLMVSSDHLYKDASIEELKDSIIPAMELEQYDILRDENGKAVSFAIWAFLNKQAHLRFAATGEVDPEYYKSGNIPWVLSLVSIKNYGPKHAYELRQIFNKMIRKKTKVYWLRHDRDMNLKSAAYGVTHVGRSE